MILNVKEDFQHIAFTAHALFTGKQQYGNRWVYQAVDIDRNIPLQLISQDGNIPTDELPGYEWDMVAFTRIPEDLLK